jgi:hypothetical protein
MDREAIGELLKAGNKNGKWPKWLWEDEEEVIMDEVLASDNIFTQLNAAVVEEPEATDEGR